MSNRCAVYVRVSTDDQRDNGYSIDSQLRMIKEYCEKNDYLIVDVYNDAGHSGKDLMRPEMQRLLDDVSKCKYEGVLVIEIERLSRGNQIDQAEILEIFKKSKTIISFRFFS